MDGCPSVEDIVKLVDVDDGEVLCIWLFGSRVFGTWHEKSDWDFIVVIENEVKGERIKEKGDLGVVIYSKDEFAKVRHCLNSDGC